MVGRWLKAERIRPWRYHGWELTNRLLKCQNMERREARMRIINDLPEQIRTSRNRDDQNDRLDIRGIVNACLSGCVAKTRHGRQ
jgi:hypothetical protein